MAERRRPAGAGRRQRPGADRPARAARAVAGRLLLSPVGTFLTNTPLYLLPGQINLQPRHRVLDLKAGHAAVPRFLAARVPFARRPVALAAAPAALRRARRALGADPPVDLVAGTPVRLPFADASFDLVLAAHLFHRLDDDALAACFAEVLRVLRPAGVLAGWAFAPSSSATLTRLHRRLLHREGAPPHLRGYRPLARLAIAAGFARVERPPFRPFLFPPIPRTAILAQKADAPG
jgi:SAM-dependent methyltransferase